VLELLVASLRLRLAIHGAPTPTPRAPWPPPGPWRGLLLLLLLPVRGVVLLPWHARRQHTPWGGQHGARRHGHACRALVPVPYHGSARGRHILDCAMLLRVHEHLLLQDHLLLVHGVWSRVLLLLLLLLWGAGGPLSWVGPLVACQGTCRGGITTRRQQGGISCAWCCNQGTMPNERCRRCATGTSATMLLPAAGKSAVAGSMHVSKAQRALKTLMGSTNNLAVHCLNHTKGLHEPHTACRHCIAVRQCSAVSAQGSA
jgi:hypothetical protein